MSRLTRYVVEALHAAVVSPVVVRRGFASIPPAALVVNNNLRELRATCRWSQADQADLADLLDVSRQTINSIETGRYDPSLPLAFKIAAVFDQSIDALFLPDADAT